MCAFGEGGRQRIRLLMGFRGLGAPHELVCDGRGQKDRVSPRPWDTSRSKFAGEISEAGPDATTEQTIREKYRSDSFARPGRLTFRISMREGKGKRALAEEEKTRNGSRKKGSGSRLFCIGRGFHGFGETIVDSRWSWESRCRRQGSRCWFCVRAELAREQIPLQVPDCGEALGLFCRMKVESVAIRAAGTTGWSDQRPPPRHVGARTEM